MKKKLKLGKLNRSFAFERASVNEDKRTVELSFSSEEPVERWFGNEVLDHGKGSVRLKRLKTGGPFLLDHDSRNQIGVVEKVLIGDDRRGRVEVRFGKSERAEEIYQDVLDGIRTNVSVGYQIHRMLLEEESDAGNTYRATDWEPYEVSLVSIPADISVGVGRGADDDHETEIQETKIKEIRTMNKCKLCGVELQDGALCTCPASVTARSAAPIVDSAKVLREIQEKETKRVGFIRTLCTDANMPEMADKLITENKTEDQARELVLDARESKLKIDITSLETKRESRIGVSLRYSKKDLQAWAGRKDPELEAYTAGRWAQAVVFGDADAKRWCDDNLDQRVMTAGVGTAGGFAVPDEMENGIIEYRDSYGRARQMCQVYPMGSGTMSVPKETGGATAYFVGEDEETTSSDVSLGSVDLVTKELSALTKISKTLDMNAVISIAALVARSQGFAFAKKEDDCWIKGDGTSTYGGILGLKTLYDGTDYLGRIDATAGDDTFKEIVSGDLDSVLAAVRSYARQGSTWLASPVADNLVFGRIVAAGGGNTIATLNGSTGMGYLGYPRDISEACPNGAATVYNDTPFLYFGNFSLGCAIGSRVGMSMQVLNELYAAKRQVGIISTQQFDLVNHDLGSTTEYGSIACLFGTTS